jgi:hypothetical protein
VRVLTAAQRYVDAVAQLETRHAPASPTAPPYLSLGALHLELRQVQPAEAALQRYLELCRPARSAARRRSQGATTTDDDDDDPPAPGTGPVQAWLMLAQAAEQRGDFKAAEAGWPHRRPARALEVQTRRATMLARQGKVDRARELVRRPPSASR